jgi:parallel beta-helix repeat protein
MGSVIGEIFLKLSGRGILAVVVLLLGSLFTLFIGVGFADGSILKVNPGESLQTAINAARPGDTIEVESGIYAGPVSMTKRLSLHGIDTGEGEPVIDAGGMGSAVVLLVAGSSLEGFSIENAGGSELDAGIKVSARNMTIRKNIIRDNNIGIRLQFSKDNTIEGNDFFNNDRGIFLFSSKGNTIKDNSFQDNKESLTIWESNENTIANNDIQGSKTNGIYLVSSTGNYITGNNASNNSMSIYLTISPANFILDNKIFRSSDHGIYLQKSGGNVLKNNIMSENLFDFYAEGLIYDHLNNDVDNSNLIDGRPIYYLVDASGRVIDSSSNAGAVYCIRCRNVTVKDLTMDGNDKSIYLYRTTGALVENNTVSDNNWYGIELQESSHNVLKHNNASRSKAGIYLENSSYNTIAANNAFDNTAGIVLAFGSLNNTIYLNNMVYNQNYNAYDPGENQWDNGKQGNFYDDINCTDWEKDGLCGSAWSIPTGTGVDRYPLMSPVKLNFGN